MLLLQRDKAKVWRKTWLVHSITCQKTFKHRRLLKCFSACNRYLITKCNPKPFNDHEKAMTRNEKGVFLSVTCNRGRVIDITRNALMGRK